MKYEWLDDGNDLILLPDPMLAVWEGADLEDQRVSAATKSWASLFPIADNIGVFFGGDPGMAMFTRDDAGVPTLIRWIYAEDENELINFALRRESLEVSESDIYLDNKNLEWSLFDASADPSLDDPPILQTELPIGRLRVTTDFLRGERNSAIVHAFHRVA